jgi:hypothetical protein
MPLLSQPSFGPRTALTYVTIGALLDVWTTVWYFAFRSPETPLSSGASFWLFGLFLTGLALIVIGLLLGPLGRSARKAELPPAAAVDAEARIDQTAAAHPNPVVPVAPGRVASVANAMNPASAAPMQPTIAAPPRTA